LIFVDIAGDIIERGYIRQFNSIKNIYTSDKVEFEMSFENSGNTHLKPVGEIKIYDMFKHEKGAIEINKKPDFGNVLPGDTREWRFQWDGDDDFFLLNKYKALLSVSYGKETRQSDFGEINFWVVDVKLLSIILGSIFGFLLLLFMFMKFYVSRSVKQVQDQIKKSNIELERESSRQQTKKPERPKTKVVDLRRIKK
jgi:hypothetical protein